jgi:hypothetical protein
MAKINTALLPVPSQSEALEFSDVEETTSVSTDSINEEFLDDDIFGEGDVSRDTSDVLSSDGEQQASVDRVRGSCSDSESSDGADAEPVQSASEPVVEIQWDEEAEKRKDEAAFFARLKELNEAIDNAESTLDEAKEEVKLAKATHNLAVASLQHFASKGVQYRKKPVPKPIETKLEGAEAAASADSKPIETVPESEWRQWETASILDGIEGLGSKKREAIIEHFPTFGKLMDARTESGKEHVAFHTLLPKGIGETIGTELINRMDAKIVPWM